MMLLLKQTERNQRFAAIKDDLPGRATGNLYAIKIGAEKKIDLPALAQLIETIADPVTLSFYENCLLSNPSAGYCKTIHQQFLSCDTISDWLKNYILSKMKPDVA